MGKMHELPQLLACVFCWWVGRTSICLAPTEEKNCGRLEMAWKWDPGRRVTQNDGTLEVSKISLTCNIHLARGHFTFVFNLKKYENSHIL